MAPRFQNPLKLFELIHLKPAHHISPLPSHLKHNRDGPIVPPFPSAWWLTLLLPHVAPCGIACPLLLETMSNKLSFQWQSLPDLFTLLYFQFSLIYYALIQPVQLKEAGEKTSNHDAKSRCKLWIVALKCVLNVPAIILYFFGSLFTIPKVTILYFSLLEYQHLFSRLYFQLIK